MPDLWIVAGREARKSSLMDYDVEYIVELKKKLADYFEASEIVDFLQISVEDVLDAFNEEVIDCADELEDWVGLRREGTEE